MEFKVNNTGDDKVYKVNEESNFDSRTFNNVTIEDCVVPMSLYKSRGMASFLAAVDSSASIWVCNTFFEGSIYEAVKSITETEQVVGEEALDRQVGGTHYKDMGIEPLEFCYANYGYAGLKAAVHTKVNKYIGRNKDNEVEQLDKAIHCLEILRDKAKLEESNR